MENMSAPISRLPEEILLLIFHYLDTPPPSSTRSRQEPSLLYTSATCHTLKEISLVSTTWRRIVLQLLFSYSRIRFDIEPCEQCLTDQSPTSNHFLSSPAQGEWSPQEVQCNATLRRGRTIAHQRELYRGLESYLGFIRANSLASNVMSFALVGRVFPRTQGRFPHESASTHYLFATNFWRHLYSEIHPSRVVIVAPPTDMACLTGCAVDTDGDWAFDDMEFHAIELSVPSASLLAPNRGTIVAAEAIPNQYPGVALASILTMQPWSHLALNEGSFLKAYGTYEYFERGPPSLVSSIKYSLTARPDLGQDDVATRQAPLKSFQYTAILPFANHVDFRGLLGDIDELDVKLAPDPGFLTDKGRIGRAELEDCWQEFFSAYRLIVEPFRTFSIRADGTPRLKRFISRDVLIPALQPDLDDEFTSLCLPVWAEAKPGVFTRLQSLPPSYWLPE